MDARVKVRLTSTRETRDGLGDHVTFKSVSAFSWRQCRAKPIFASQHTPDGKEKHLPFFTGSQQNRPGILVDVAWARCFL